MKTKTKIYSEIRMTDHSNESRTVEFIISTNDKDRHGTVLNMAGWNLDNFNKNGIVGYNHEVYSSTNPDLILGTGKAWTEGEGANQKLIGKVTFEPEDVNPLAEKIFRKVQNGTLKATSVGFTPVPVNGKYGEERNGTFHYFGQELLEFSIVNIPSNPNAVKRSAEEIEEMFIIEKRQEEEEVVEDQKINFREKLLLLKTKKIK